MSPFTKRGRTQVDSTVLARLRTPCSWATSAARPTRGAAWFSEDPIWSERQVREAMAPYGDHTNLAVHYLLSPTGG